MSATIDHLIADSPASAISVGDIRRPIRCVRWPRRQALSVALGCTLIAALTIPASTAAGDADQLAFMAVITALLAGAARMVFELPLRHPAVNGPRGSFLVAAAVATTAVAFALLLELAVGRLPETTPALGSWASTIIVLMLAAAARRAEVAYGTGRRLFLVGNDAQLFDLRSETSFHGGPDIVEHRDPAARGVADSLFADLRAARATLLVLSDDALRSPEIVQAAVQANLAGVRVRDLRGFYEAELGKVATSELSLAWFLFDIAAIHRRRLYGTTKRVVEGLAAVVLLIAMAPLFPLIAIAIKRSSPGPVFFRQPRVGLNGRCFTLSKFRTMHERPGEEHGRWAGASADRVFPVGRILRRLRLDELPQLLLVVRGELSLVGPRPEQPAIVERLKRELPFYAARHVVRPGVTGWAQVNLGYAGSDAGTVAKLQCDLYYIKRQGMLFDLRIMAATVRAALLGGGS